jgi:hypothetical protein
MSGELLPQRNFQGATQAGEAQLARTVQEIQAMVLVAKKWPRDENLATQRIQRACQKLDVAEGGEYEYPRGDTRVSGGSIRLAEIIASAWGNLDFGYIVIDETPGVDSDVLAFAWDLETNTRASRRFRIPHVREKKSGNVILTDPRDVYEIVANMAQRRVRAAVFGVVPRDLVDFAREQCRKTIADKDKRPAHEKLQEMLAAFGEFGVSQDQLVAYLRHALGATTDKEFMMLRRIYVTLKDQVRKPEDYFATIDGTRPAGDGQGDKPKTKAQQMAADVRKTSGGPAGSTPQPSPNAGQSPAPEGKKKGPGRPPGLKARIAAMTDDTLFGLKGELEAMPAGEQRDEYQRLFDERLNQIDAEKGLAAGEQKPTDKAARDQEAGGLFGSEAQPQREPGDET